MYGQLVRGADAGSGAYVRNIAFDKATGEIVEGRELTLDTEKITEEEKYDGYYSVVTSELNMSDYEIRDTYRGLARIEETFKISKTEFESRRYLYGRMNIYQFVYYDEILKECGHVFNLELNHKYRTQEQMRRLLKY